MDSTNTPHHFPDDFYAFTYSPYWMVFDFSLIIINYHTPAMAYVEKGPVCEPDVAANLLLSVVSVDTTIQRHFSSLHRQYLIKIAST